MMSTNSQISKMKSYFDKWENSNEKNKFFILNVIIYFGNGGENHANMLLFNPNTKEVELFEPHGKCVLNNNANSSKINTIIHLFMTSSPH